MTPKPAFLDFPYERIVYERNPLVEVVCQIRFPQLLRIEASPPADFQDRVQDTYPQLEIKDGIEIGLPLHPDAPQQPIRSSRSYSFYDSARAWHLALASNFLALSTTNYEEWPDFRARLEHALTVLDELYSPRTCTRVGLRYRNVIDRGDLALQKTPWAELLNPAVLGWLSKGPLNDPYVESFASRILYSYDGDKILVQSGLVENRETEDRGFLIDADFFIDKDIQNKGKEVVRDADRLYGYAGPFFRWCIESPLHEALGPNKMGSPGI